jgi:hypothetical protein
MDDHKLQSAARVVDRHIDRLLRDLIAIGMLEANNRPPAAERLATKLGEDLHRALLAELNRSDSGASPLRTRPHHAA